MRSRRAKGPKKTVLVNTGGEAVENAIKLRARTPSDRRFSVFEDAFHGRTYMAMAATSKTHPYKAGFEPFPSEVYRIPYAYCYRCAYSMKYPSCDVHCARHLEDTFLASCGGPSRGGCGRRSRSWAKAASSFLRRESIPP